VSTEDVTRWQRLFGFSEAGAIRYIEDYRNDISRLRISNDLWATVQMSKEAEGFDREAYEYSLMRRKALPSTRLPPQETSGTFIVKLAGPLDTTEKIKEAADLTAAPVFATGTRESGVPAYFCEIDGEAREKLLNWISQHHPGFQPTIVRIAKAKKDLCAHSLAPTLGKDATLPQSRLNDDSDCPLPVQDQYPVWYFFYGTLCDPEILTGHLNLEDDPPELIPAHIQGGQMRTWAGKYKALVDTLESTAKVCMAKLSLCEIASRRTPCDSMRRTNMRLLGVGLTLGMVSCQG
jgi:hypothetical protein